MKIKVNITDLIGDLKGFPFEIVEKMLEYQYKQKGRIDIKVFQDNRAAAKEGFCWEDTIEGYDFWNAVIKKRFDVFFERYAKSKEVYISGNARNGENVIKELESRGGVNIWNKKGTANHMLYFIDPVTNYIERVVDPQCKNLLRTCYTEISPGEYAMVELTMGEIAEKFGVDVELLRIKK